MRHKYLSQNFIESHFLATQILFAHLGLCSYPVVVERGSVYCIYNKEEEEMNLKGKLS